LTHESDGAIRLSALLGDGLAESSGPGRRGGLLVGEGVNQLAQVTRAWMVKQAGLAGEYAPFGKRIADESHVGIVKTGAPGHVPQAGVQGIKLDLRLPGQWEDAESGLYYNDQRYYDPNKGRYLSPDPLGIGGGLNGYAYVGNNPLGFSDPLGLVRRYRRVSDGRVGRDERPVRPGW